MTMNMEKVLKLVSNRLVSISVLSISLLLFKSYLKIGSRNERALQEDGKGTDESNGKKVRPAPTAPPMAKEGFVECIKILADGKNSLDHLVRTARELKSQVYRMNIHLLFGAPMCVFVGDGKLTREILRDRLTTKTDSYEAFAGSTKGISTIFTSKGGEYWHSRRKGLSSAFSSKHVKRMNMAASQKINEWIQTKLEIYAQNDEAFNIGDEMINMTLGIISEAAFEYDMSEDEKKLFTTELMLCCEEFAMKSTMNPWRKPFGFFIKERRRAYVAADHLELLAFKIMNRYKKCNNPSKDTIIDHIMKNDAYKNDNERAADVTTLLIAGHDTTAYTIAWIVKELAKNPKEQEKLRDSLQSTETENWHQLDALKNVIKEGMRLHPVAGGGLGRIIGRDFITDDNFLLKKGSFISIPLYMQFHDHNVYKDPDLFIPSRWDNPTTEMDDSFVPFAVGARNCVGLSLANAIINTIIPTICSQFELKLENEGHMVQFLTVKTINTMVKAKKI
jgi:cytochrome P450